MRVITVTGPASGGMRRVAAWLEADRRRRGWVHHNLALPAALPLAASPPFHPDLIEAHGWRAGLWARWLARRRRLDVPIIMVAHTYPPPGMRGWLWGPLERTWLPLPHRYVAVSPSLGRWLSDRLSVPVHVVPLLPPCPIQARPLARRELGLEPGEGVVGSIGRLTWAKGFDTLLVAWSRLPPAVRAGWRLCIIGDGPDAGRLRRLAERLGIASRITWAGARPQAGRLTSAFDLYVQPSRSEGAGLAAVEAGRAGVPAVLAATGGLVDLAGDGATLVPPDDAGALARALAEAMIWSEARRRSLGRRGAAISSGASRPNIALMP